jgi:hypothetical protein
VYPNAAFSLRFSSDYVQWAVSGRTATGNRTSVRCPEYAVNTAYVRATGINTQSAEDIDTIAPTRSTGGVCEVHPIGLSQSQLSNVVSGTLLADVLNGLDNENVGWLSWNGDQSETFLAEGLRPVGNSYLYLHPINLTDRVLSVGDVVVGSVGVQNSKAIRDNLDQLKAIDITVPVWDVVSGVGVDARYHISAFAKVHITTYNLANGNPSVGARFLGYTTCE